MPKIPGYSSQNAFTGQISPNIAINDEGIKAGIAQNTRTLEEFALRGNKLQANAAKNRVAQKFAEEQRRIQSEWTPDSGEDMLSQASEAYTRIVDEELVNASNSVSRNMMASQFGDMQAAYQMKDQEYVFVQQQKEAGRQYANEKNMMSNEAYNGMHPEAALARSESTAQELQLPDSLSRIVDEQANPKVYNSWFAGQIDRADQDINELRIVKETLNEKQYNKKLLDSDKIQLNKAIDSRIRALETRSKQQYTTMFDDALISIAAGGNTAELPTSEELDLAIAEVASLPNSENLVRDLKIKQSAIEQTRGYADMTFEEIRQQGIDLQGDFSYLNAGSAADTADAIRTRELVGTINADYQKAWSADPHHMHDQYSNGRYNDIDLSSPEGMSQTIVERRAAQQDIKEVQGLVNVPLFRPQDYHQAAMIWESNDSQAREALVYTSQQAMPLVTPENREAMAEWSMGVTGGDPVMAAAFLSPDPSAYRTMVAGKSNAKLMQTVDAKAWREIKEYAFHDLLGQFDADSDAKETYADVLAHHVAGQLSSRDDKTSMPDRSELKKMYEKAASSLLGTRVELNGSVAFVPHSRQGDLIPEKDIREAVYGLNDEGIVKATGGFYDQHGNLMEDHRFTIRSGSFITRKQGVMLEIEYENGQPGVVYGADGKPLVFDFEKLQRVYSASVTNQQISEFKAL